MLRLPNIRIERETNLINDQKKPTGNAITESILTIL